MKKIPSLFKRDYEGNRQVYDEVVPGCEWVLSGEGVATEKYDGTACMVRDGKLFKRYDRKLNKRGKCKAAPEGWEPCEGAPDEHTGHWPGWVPVGEEPESKYYRKAWAYYQSIGDLPDGTYELVGPKVQGNPYALMEYGLWEHGLKQLSDVPRWFDGIRVYLSAIVIEGIVWHHSDGRMCKVKRRDFGLPWPVPEGRGDK